MSVVLIPADRAFHKLSEENKNYLLLIDITILFSILRLQEGDFKAGKEKATTSLELRREHKLPEDLAMTNAYNYLGLACHSTKRCYHALA